jgi:transcriptional regulator with XRE-family HTH domain
MSEPAQVPGWTLGWRLKRALDFGHVSAQQMADELGVHPGTVSRFMNDRETPRRGYLKLWALRTGVPLEWLELGDDGLPRVDSNHQPAGWLSETAPVTTAELLALRKALPIRQQSRVTA